MTKSRVKFMTQTTKFRVEGPQFVKNQKILLKINPFFENSFKNKITKHFYLCIYFYFYLFIFLSQSLTLLPGARLECSGMISAHCNLRLLVQAILLPQPPG